MTRDSRERERGKKRSLKEGGKSRQAEQANSWCPSFDKVIDRERIASTPPSPLPPGRYVSMCPEYRS